jgi:hypothetical protein
MFNIVVHHAIGLEYVSSSPDIYESGETRWNDISRENQITRRKPCPSATLFTTSRTRTNPGANSRLIQEARKLFFLSILTLHYSEVV